MKSWIFYRRTLLSVILGGCMSSASVLTHAQAQLDQVAPEFSTSTADGNTFNIASQRGKTVVLEWTNHECPYVKKHYSSGNIQGLQKDAISKGIVWLQVVSSAPGKQGFVDGSAAIKVNAERNATPTATLLDPTGKVARLYGAQTTPHIFIVNPQGQVVFKGGIDSIATNKVEDISRADNYVRTALAELGAGKKISQPNTRPYGCSIKFGDS